MSSTVPTNQNGEATRAVATAGDRAPVSGLYRDLDALWSRFQELQQRFNLAFPVVRPDFIPPLHAVAVRVVALDATHLPTGPVRQPGESADFYFDGKVKAHSITKVGLEKIAAAMGVSWHPALSGRVDDGSDALFRRYRVTGVFTAFDGRDMVIAKHKTMDLRDGSPQVAGMSAEQLAQARKFIDEQCESKAMNRVIRSIAHLKSSYTRDELKRPFAVLATVFTGETDDPVMKQEVARRMLDRALDSSAKLFGPGQLPGGVQHEPLQRTAPPPVGLVSDHADDPVSHDREPGSDDVTDTDQPAGNGQHSPF
jgi:hypothetical protein